jgi:hypothetical protein
LGREQNDPAHLPECRKIGGWLLDLYKSGVLPSRFGVVDVLLARSRSEAPGLWSRLEPHSHDQRVELVQTDRELVAWGLAELVSRRSARIAPENPSQAVELAELGVFLALLPVLRDLGLAHGSQLDRVRVRWVEARIAAGLGERELGEQGLFEVRQDFLRLTIVFDAALATLELSALYLEDGKTAEVKRLAAEIVEVFEAQAVHREALAALLIFQRAADKETATASLLREVTEMLERARRL